MLLGALISNVIGVGVVILFSGLEILESSEQCLEIARQDRPDLILLDVVLPDILGLEVCSQIKTDPFLKGCYVILVSGTKIESSEQADGLCIGADGYIPRPISNGEFLARVHAMVRILKAERERDHLIIELQQALDKVKTLTGRNPPIW